MKTFFKKGFTLVEMMVILFIIIILSIIVLPNLKPSKARLALERSAVKLAQDIRWAQQLAMSARDSEQCPGHYSHGISFSHYGANNNKYIIYVNCAGNQAYQAGWDDLLEEISLEDGVIFSLSGSTLNILFTPPQPTTVIMGTPVITLRNEAGTKRVSVNGAGSVTVE